MLVTKVVSLVFFLDVLKAFDRPQCCKLFRLMVNCHIQAPIVRALINFCTDNHTESYGAVSYCSVS